MIRLDTHVVVWLYTGQLERLSELATESLEREDLVFSPTVELELTYLHEIGRLTVSGTQLIADLRARIGLVASGVPLIAVVAAAAPLSWTRDPFDRLIVGDALAANGPLLTKDDSIRRNCALARW